LPSSGADYFTALPEAERPRYIITSDFARFRLTDLRSNTTHECTLAQLAKRADWFSFLLDDDAAEIAEESKIDRKAAYQVSRLHQALLDARFIGHDLEVFMTRLLFCSSPTLRASLAKTASSPGWCSAAAPMAKTWAPC